MANKYKYVQCSKCLRRKLHKAKGLCGSCYNKPFVQKRYWATREQHRIYNRTYHLDRTFGLSPEEYDRLLSLQGGVCAICQTPPKKIRLSVDHDHETGKVRGLLCPTCNRFLIHMTTYAERAKIYLARFTKPRSHRQ